MNTPCFRPTAVHLAHHADGGLPVLIADLCYYDYSGRRHHVPAGFRTDGGSKPRLFWRVLGHPFDRALPSYVVHDWYCHKARQLKAAGETAAAVTLRRDADRLMREMHRHLGLSSVKANLEYAGVRIGAWFGGLAG